MREKPSRIPPPGDTSEKREKIVFASGGTEHALEKLPSVQNADAVEEHDEAGDADRSGDLRLWRKRANREPDEKYSAHAQREAADVDLADQVTDADGEKQGEDLLRSEDLASNIQHVVPLALKLSNFCRCD